MEPATRAGRLIGVMMAKQIIALAGLTAEDMGYIRAVIDAEIKAEKPHWGEPPPDGFAERFADCQRVALSSLETELVEKTQRIADLEAAELTRR